MPKKAKLDRLDVQYRMRRLGITQETLARDLGTKQENISSVMRGRTRTPRIRKALVTALGIPFAQLSRALGWPDAPGEKDRTEKVA